MRNYGIRLIAGTAIIVIVLSFLLKSSSDDGEKYSRGTLIKADERFAYALSADCETCGYETGEAKDYAVYAYAKGSETAENTVKSIYDAGTEAFIDSSSDNLVYVRKPEI